MLRGINVSGHNLIKMAELKSLYESLGLCNVQTYIQSGNVIFESSSSDADILKTIIEKEIEITFGFSIAVLIRSTDNFVDVIKNNPFMQKEIAEDNTKLLVAFLSETPSEAATKSIRKYAVPPEDLVARNREIYLLFPNGYGKSKLSNSFLEKKLGVIATARNWKTVTKLYELSMAHIK